MATYTTNLKDWGATGSEYPDGYNYEDDVPPIDLYDNFLTSNLITDVQHLIGLTNDRIEADKGGSGGEPASPEDSHLYHDQGNDRLEVWDGSTSSWRGLLYSDGDTMSGSLDMGGFGVTGTGDITDDNGNTVYDLSAGHVPVGQIEQGSGSALNADQVDGKDASELGSGVSDNGTEVVSPATDFNFGSSLDVTDDGDGTVTIDAITSSDTHTAVSEDGTQMYGSVDDINFQGFLNLIDDGDGTVSLDPAHNHDSRYYTQSEADGNFDNFGSFTVTEGNGSETSTIGSGGNISIYGGTDIQTEMDASDNLQVSMTGNYDNYGHWSLEDDDNHNTDIYSGTDVRIDGGTDIDTNISSTGGYTEIDISHGNTTSQGDVTTGGSTVIDDIYIDGNGHVTNLNTQNRSLDDWNAPSSTVYFDRDGIQSNADWMEIDGNGNGLLLNYKNQGEETRIYGTLDVRGGVSGLNHNDLGGVSSNDHHSRYSDSEARTAVDGANINISGDAGSVGGFKAIDLLTRY
jgi:hypothetical protein